MNGLKGKNTIDLGKGGQDSIVIKADLGKAKLNVTTFTKKDELTVGKITLDYKDIKGGAEIPNVKVELA